MIEWRCGESAFDANPLRGQEVEGREERGEGRAFACGVGRRLMGKLGTALDVPCRERANRFEELGRRVGLTMSREYRADPRVDEWIRAGHASNVLQLRPPLGRPTEWPIG